MMGPLLLVACGLIGSAAPPAAPLAPESNPPRRDYVTIVGARPVRHSPLTDQETVLDAIAQVTGLPAKASKRYLWVSRLAPDRTQGRIVLPVDWRGIVMGGQAATNHALQPGDQIHVSDHPPAHFAWPSGYDPLRAPRKDCTSWMGITCIGGTERQQTKKANEGR
jgi:hypothetical protein